MKMLVKFLRLFRPEAEPFEPDALIGAAEIVREILGDLRTGLEVQRVLYLAQMRHLAEFDLPIFPDFFRASDSGPVIPRLRDHFRRKRRKEFAAHRQALSDSALLILDQVAKECRDLSNGDLVALTHANNGAWARHFKRSHPQRAVSGPQIPYSSMVDEHILRTNSRARQAP